ncbi:hypothetical protein TGAM01_v205795 [Trichoderma gamsii]|uniref:Uncharacterized protein n=1 Tax=Trichoderma gamsii TaxID=398673 RepID=A0A2P4ZMI1_9HYPO|nr:hypothetical protein TGAM01_v205795 [Trichoderma gamsii]PON25501.1 hypothetical protein TGAM01_v205795 [Trichoderma gamsii]
MPVPLPKRTHVATTPLGLGFCTRCLGPLRSACTVVQVQTPRPPRPPSHTVAHTEHGLGHRARQPAPTKETERQAATAMHVIYMCLCGIRGDDSPEYLEWHHAARLFFVTLALTPSSSCQLMQCEPMYGPEWRPATLTALTSQVRQLLRGISLAALNSPAKAVTPGGVPTRRRHDEGLRDSTVPTVTHSVRNPEALTEPRWPERLGGSSSRAAVRFGGRRTATAWCVRWCRYVVDAAWTARFASIAACALFAVHAAAHVAAIAIRPRRNKGKRPT